MAWKSSGTSTSNKYWSYNSTYNGLTRKNVDPGATVSLWYNLTTVKYFSLEKTYLFKYVVDNFGHTNNYKYLISETPWSDRFTHSWSSPDNLSTLPSSTSSTTLNFYSSPNTSASYADVAFFKSTYNGFGTQSGNSVASVIKSIDIVEFDWFVQGWAWSSTTDNYMGWRYNDSNNSFEYSHYSSGVSFRRLPANGHTQSNYISKYIPFDFYNLSFNFKTPNTSVGYIDLYLTDNLPSSSTTLSTFTASLWSSTNNNQYVGRISTTYSNTDVNFQFYNLSGNRYLTAVANFSGGNGSTYSFKMTLSDIVIQGGYQELDNNEQFLFTNTSEYNEPTPLEIIGGSSDATYSTVTTTPQTLHDPSVGNSFGATGYPGFFSTTYGQVTNLSQLYSKVGNGTFRAGIWENGVWNSGWRVDEQIYDFNDVLGAFSTDTRNTRWRVLITGPTSSAAQFEIGDKVSIGNIVSININEERKLLKNYFTIINKNETDLIVEFDNNFPIRRIIKDSDNHKIRITKNVWLNGGFLNGYFEGIWNNGLFKGYPLITEMDKTHWIDGIFDGGRFKSRTISYNFANTWYQNGYVGLSFSSPHGFLTGDLIFIDKDDPTINPQYNGNATVTSVVDDYLVVIDRTWGSNSTLESGLVTRRTKTGLIQNFNFSDNNVASKNAKQSTTLKDIWKFNSWMDLNYSTQSVVTVNRDRIYFNSHPETLLDFTQQKYGLGDYTVPNLYGYLTEDVLSSKSTFRDIDTFNRRKYSLGTKHEIYQDFLTDISEFNNPFGTTASLGGLSSFFQDGWTFSFSGEFPSSSPIPYTFSRTGDGTLKYQGSTTAYSLINFDNTNINIEKRRYSLIEFDIVDSGNLNSVSLNPDGIVTLFNFPRFINNEGVFTSTSAFPNSDEVNYLNTGNTKNKAYFYNRPGLDIGLLNIAGSYYELDNIKFYELDAIPFFQYTTEDYVNKSVQVPYQGSAPFIDYNNVNFSFVDNIVISLDSIQVSPSNTTFIPSTTLGGYGDLYNNIQVER